MDKKLRIYVDHGEAYGNLGDEAMLLNALLRLDKYLGPCEFVLPYVPSNPLPQGLSKVIKVPSPYKELIKWGNIFDLPFAIIRKMPLLSNLHIFDYATSLILASKWLNLRLYLLNSGLPPTSSNDLKSFLSLIKTCDIFYGVGAADFNDFWLTGVIYKCWLYTFAKSYVKIIAISSQGIGPLKTEWAQKMMRKAFSNVDLLSFRDHSVSQSIVEREKPENVIYKIVGDEALTLPTGNEQAIEKLLHDSGLPDGASYIATHFRSSDYTQDTTHMAARLAEILDIIAESVPHYFIFFPMSYHEHSGRDKDYGSLIKSLMSHRERLLIAPLCKDVCIVKGAVGKAKYSLGLSYHIHVFSLSQGHPAIILFSGSYYKYKSEGLIEFYGSPNIAIDLQDCGNDKIIESVKKIENDYNTVCAKIFNVNEKIIEDNDWMLRELAKMKTKVINYGPM